jgi:hypothetical protein
LWLILYEACQRMRKHGYGILREACHPIPYFVARVVQLGEKLHKPSR